MAKTTNAPAPSSARSRDSFAATRPIGAATRGQQLPKFGPRTRAFMLASHYTSWELVQTTKGWRLVPTLKRLVVMAGVNWTPQAPKGKALDSSHIEAKMRSRFDYKVLIDLDDYLVEVDGDGAPGIFLRWERVKTYSDGNFSIDMDHDGYDLWRWSLIVDRRLEPPRDDIVSEIRLRLRKAIDRSTRTPHLAQAQRAVAAAERRMQGLEEALAALDKAFAPSSASAAQAAS